MTSMSIAFAAAVSLAFVEPAAAQAPPAESAPDPASAPFPETHETPAPDASAPAKDAATTALAPAVAAVEQPETAAVVEQDPEPARPHEIDEPPPPDMQRLLHGFRLGYMFVNDYDKPIDGDDPESSLKEQLDMKSPHLFVIGYEVMRRMVGHSWLNVILVGNAMVAGLEQSKFYPSANFLIGFEIDRSFQIGVGPNLTPTREKAAHVLFAAGWTPLVGRIYMPIHAFYVPDVDGNFRTGMTVGVNW